MINDRQWFSSAVQLMTQENRNFDHVNYLPKTSLAKIFNYSTGLEDF